jgi:predicted transcriptional regulator
MSEQKVPGAGLFSGLSEKIQEAESAESKPTMNMAALLELPTEQRRIVRHLLRADAPPTVEETAAALEMTVEDVNVEVGRLTLIGLVEKADGRLRAIAGWRSSRLPPGGVWSSLGGL